MRNFLAVQWLGLGAHTAKGPGSIPGWEKRFHKPSTTGPKNKKKKKVRKVFEMKFEKNNIFNGKVMYE